MRERVSAASRRSGVCRGSARTPQAEGIRQEIERARRGDRASFEGLYVRLQPRVRSTVVALIRDGHEAEDIVQDTFLMVYRRMTGLRDVAAFDGWVMRIARNLALDHARRAKRCRPSLRVYHDAGDWAPDLPRVVRRSGSGEASAEARVLVREALERLPDAVRRALELRYTDGLSCKEIGHREGLGPSCVKTRLHRGRRELIAALG